MNATPVQPPEATLETWRCLALALLGRPADLDFSRPRKDVAALANGLGVGPAVAHALTGLSPAHPWNLEWARAMRDATAARLTAQLADATTASDALGPLFHLYVKGTALHAAGLIPLGTRHQDDVDLVVRQRDYPQAAARLRGAGFSPTPRVHYDGSASELGWAGRLAAWEGPNGTPFDIHLDEDCTRWFRPREAQLTAAGTVRRVPIVRAPEDLVFQICHHVGVHHADNPSHIPRVLADIVQLTRAHARARDYFETSRHAGVVLIRRRLKAVSARPDRAIRLLQAPLLPHALGSLYKRSRNAGLTASVLTHTPSAARGMFWPSSTYLSAYGLTRAGESHDLARVRRIVRGLRRTVSF